MGDGAKRVIGEEPLCAIFSYLPYDKVLLQPNVRQIKQVGQLLGRTAFYIERPFIASRAGSYSNHIHMHFWLLIKSGNRIRGIFVRLMSQ